MWRRLIPMYRAVSSDLTFDWCVSGGSPNPEAWYPGDDVVDVVGMDQYDIVWQHPGGDPAQRWAFLQPNYQWHADFAAQHGKPAAIDEWALWTSRDATQGGGGDNPTFISNVAAWAAAHRYLHVAYFNVTSGGPGMTLEQAPDGLRAYRERVRALSAPS
jgi:hypothetical protein